MSEKKFFEMQQQVRRNNEDLQDYLRDMNNWETDIKRKDDELRHEKSGPADGGERILPPVRNRQDQLHEKKVRKKKKTDVVEKPATIDKNQNGNSGEKKRIQAYDYRSWDKFDVDKACAEVDSDGAEEAASSDTADYETDSDAERDMEEMRRKVQEGIAEKDKGNALFKQGKYNEAVICYTAGMEADPSNSILPANRAMSLLKLKRYSEAETDCNKAISLDCTYVKAYARRGAARIELAKLEDAKKDFQQVLNLESSNKQAVSEIKRINKILREKQEKVKKSEEPCNIVKAVEKPIHLRSNKPLKRISIEEIGTGSEADSPRSTIPNTGHNSNPKDSNVPSLPKDATVCDKLSSSTTGKTSDEKSNRQSANSAKANKATSTKKPAADSLPFQRASSPPSVPPAPHSSFQLEADLKKLDKYPQQMYQYFKQISADKLPVLFQQSLDSTMLMKIIVLLQQHYVPNNEPIYAVLKHLTQVKRFDMNVMFMSKKEKQVAADLVEYCKTLKSQTDEELNVLAKKYGL